jgi:hypothetical protein
MRTALSSCPACGSELTVTRLHCRNCDTAVEGRFAQGPFRGLSGEQHAFLETFVRCEGKFTRMEGELGLSYPTLRSRLHDIIRAMGYEPGSDDTAPTEEVRRGVLKELEEGKLSAEDAIARLKGDRA